MTVSRVVGLAPGVYGVAGLGVVYRDERGAWWSRRVLRGFWFEADLGPFKAKREALQRLIRSGGKGRKD